MSEGKLRVLLLHGYAMNQTSFRRRIAALQKSCRDVAEFVFANGPHHVPTLPSESNPDPLPPNPDDPPEKQARAWFMSREGKYIGWGVTAAYLTEFIREHGPFDGVIGFSQGACLSGILTAAAEHPDRIPEVSEPILTQPFRFAISISGFRAADPKFDPLYSEPIQTPVLMIHGENDSIVTNQRAQTLIDRCHNLRVLRHPGEHYVPTSAPWRRFIHDLLVSFVQNDHDAWRVMPSPLDEENVQASNKL